ncbi:helix-turn-helix domain-containing protein [Gloeothece verrucosa]|uniref:Putative transcription regulator with HTH domain n=1 Tax=Gloeothece verrucosa (strain PCC 7822) TaxID=497965 RepID=E0UGA4_GLOV7|nr:putative transcriptional regulator with HTH domain [Gloeothece verrucosa]ADN16723.1 putative transcription regulator with HTH domain [Gloeothece verrucosa PCC 7822]
MLLKPIKTETDYQKALAEIESLFDAQPNTPEYERLDLLTTLVEAYEKIHYPIAPPDPIEAILYYLNSRGLSIDALQNDIENKINITDILEDNQAKPHHFATPNSQTPITVTLDPDVAAVFTTSEAVNHALRTLLSNSKNS